MSDQTVHTGAAAPAGHSDPYGITDPEGPSDGAVFNAAGGDWDDVAEEAAALGEERIVVNMGPQHPSTHGVLRLILEIDGESVTEARAGIGYLHTGIEKNMEFRTWTQGVTFCTRMDYLTPMFQETAYCLGIERLLGITDQVPERASIIRVLMMELTRISSHLVATATGGMEMGATTVMTIGFRERERVLKVIENITGLRMNNAYIRPGGVAQDLPARRHRPDPRHGPRGAPRPRRARGAAAGEPGPEGPHGRRRLPGPDRLHRAGHHRPDPALDRPAARPAQDGALLRLRDLRLRGHDARHLRRLRPALHPARRVLRVAVDHRAGRRTGCRRTPGPVMVEDKKIAWPAQLAIGRDGMGNSLDHIRNIMGTSMEALIHHFKLVTEGFRVPAGQVYQAVESPKGELGVHLVSDGGTRPYRAHFRDPSFNNLQATAAMCEGGQLADVIVAVASIDPVMGGVDR